LSCVHFLALCYRLHYFSSGFSSSTSGAAENLSSGRTSRPDARHRCERHSACRCTVCRGSSVLNALYRDICVPTTR
jgi:hypothetical protein